MSEFSEWMATFNDKLSQYRAHVNNGGTDEDFQYLPNVDSSWLDDLFSDITKYMEGE